MKRQSGSQSQEAGLESTSQFFGVSEIQDWAGEEGVRAVGSYLYALRGFRNKRMGFSVGHQVRELRGTV